MNHSSLVALFSSHHPCGTAALVRSRGLCRMQRRWGLSRPGHDTDICDKPAGSQFGRGVG